MICLNTLGRTNIWGSACFLMAGLCSQSDPGHLDRISPVLPTCNQKHWNWALHRTKCGRNMSLESRERLWQGVWGWFLWSQKGQIIQGAKQTSHIPHLTFKHSYRASLKLRRLTQVRSTRASTVAKHQTIWNKAAFTLPRRWKGIKSY